MDQKKSNIRNIQCQEESSKQNHYNYSNTSFGNESISRLLNQSCPIKSEFLKTPKRPKLDELSNSSPCERRKKAVENQRILTLLHGFDENLKLTEEIFNCSQKVEVKYMKPHTNGIDVEAKMQDLEEKCKQNTERISELEWKLKDAMKYQRDHELQNVELQNLKLQYDTQIERLNRDLANAHKQIEESKKLEFDLQKKVFLVTRDRTNENLAAIRATALEHTIEIYSELITRLTGLLGCDHSKEFKKLKEENEKEKDEIEHRALWKETSI